MCGTTRSYRLVQSLLFRQNDKRHANILFPALFCATIAMYFIVNLPEGACFPCGMDL